MVKVRSPKRERVCIVVTDDLCSHSRGISGASVSSLDAMETSAMRSSRGGRHSVLVCVRRKLRRGGRGALEVARVGNPQR